MGLKGKFFTDQTEDVVSDSIAVKHLSSAILMFDKTGAGTCTISFEWKLRDLPFQPIPDESGDPQSFNLDADAQDGQVLLPSTYGVNDIRASISNTVGIVSVDCSIGGTDNV